MSAFVATSTTMTGSAVKIVDAADFDRSVSVHIDTIATFSIGFTSGVGFTLGSNSSSDPRNAVSFVLPADEELWASGGSGNVLRVLVSGSPG